MNIALVGCGYWGLNYARIFHELPDVSLNVACDGDRKRLDALKEQYPAVRTTQSYEDVLHDDSIDGVVLAVPTSLHYTIAKACLRAGKHVLVEKPLAVSSRECEDLVAIAKDAGKTLMVGHTFLFNPAVRALQECVQGDIGDLFYLYCTRTGLGPVRSDVNALWDLAPHDVSILLYLLGEMPDRVSASGSSYLRKGVEDVVFATLSFGDVLAHLHVSWLDPHKTRKITVVGNRKMVQFDDVAPVEKIRIYDKGVDKPYFTPTYADFIQLSLRDGEVVVPKIEMSEPLKNQCIEFLRRIQGRGSSISDGGFGVRVVRVLEAAQRSLKEGGTVAL